jgi:DNA-binding MarR family transcriptional regulator
MVETLLDVQTEQIIELITDLTHHRHRLITMLPKELMQVREHLENFRTADGPKRVAEKELFFRVGFLLSRQNEPLAMGELSKVLAVPLSTATRIVDWLVEGKYVERMPDPDDRRVVRVALTKNGLELYGVITQFFRQQIMSMLSQFTPEEREQLVSLLRKAVRIMGESQR